jgi:hypothetical protein
VRQMLHWWACSREEADTHFLLAIELRRGRGHSTGQSGCCIWSESTRSEHCPCAFHRSAVHSHRHQRLAQQQWQPAATVTWRLLCRAPRHPPVRTAPPSGLEVLTVAAGRNRNPARIMRSHRPNHLSVGHTPAGHHRGALPPATAPRVPAETDRAAVAAVSWELVGTVPV